MSRDQCTNPARGVKVLVVTGVVTALVTAGSIAVGLYMVGRARAEQEEAARTAGTLRDALEQEVQARLAEASGATTESWGDLEMARSRTESVMQMIREGAPAGSLRESLARLGSVRHEADTAAADLRRARAAMSETAAELARIKEQADGVLAEARQTLERAEGRARVRELNDLKRRAEGATGTPEAGAPDASAQVRALARRLHVLDSGVLEMSLVLEQVMGQASRPELESLRDNRLLPIMARLTDVASQVEAEAPGLVPTLDRVQVLVFGEGAVLDPGSQTVAVGRGGLLAAKRAALRAAQGREDLREHQAGLIESLRRESVEVERGLEAVSAATIAESERALAGAWAFMSVVVCLSTGVLVVTGVRVGRATARQFEAMEAARASLTEQHGLVVTANEELVRSSRERERLQEALVTASRQAGRAEVASGVLHNVGNVLTSVNIAATAASGHLHRSEAATLARAATMLRQHRGNLPALFAPGQRGEALADLVIELAERWASENGDVARELTAVARGIEHIRHVITAQQARAKRATMIERVTPADLVQATLEMQAEALRKHGVRVEREVVVAEAMETDKHAVLEILINLVANAGKAMREASERVLTIRVAAADGAAAREAGGEGVIVFEVRDTGVGISKENLARVFTAGFTTRSDGHGLGLHTAANAAQRLGGTLTAHSAGLGKGATFRLELPRRPRAGSGDAPESGSPEETAGSIGPAGESRAAA